MGIVSVQKHISFVPIMVCGTIIASFFAPEKYGPGLSSTWFFVFPAMMYIHHIVLDKLTICLLLQVISSFVSSALGSVLYNFEFPLRSLITFSISALFVAMINACDFKEKHRKIIFNVYIYSAILAICLVYYSFFSGQMNGGYYRYTANLFGVEKDQLYLASFILPAVYLVLNRAIVCEIPKMKYVLSFLFLIGGLFLTGNRSSLLIVLAIIGFTIFRFAYQSGRVIKTILGLLFIVVLLFFFANICFEYLPNQLLSRIFTVSSYTEDTSRFDMWSYGWEIFKESPLLGIGFDNLNISLKDNGFLNSHNVYLDILCAQGIVGFLIFLSYLYSIYRLAEDKIYVIGFMGASLGTLFVLNGYNTMNYWVPLFLIAFVAKYNCK